MPSLEYSNPAPIRQLQAGESNRFDVAVVGFGPVGAVLAGLLGRRGLKVVVFDRETGVYPLPRAAHIDHTGLRTLQELGSLADLLPRMILNPGTDCVTADRRLLLTIPSDQPTVSGLPASMYFYQPTFDTSLRESVAAQPNVEVRLGSDVHAIQPEPDGVRVVAHSSDGVERAVKAGWVVGCDGASSTVRRLTGIERTGFGFEEQWVIFDLLLRPGVMLPPKAVQVCDPSRPHTELPMPEGRYRFEFMLMPGEDAAELQRADTAFDRLLAGLVDTDAATIERTATYTFRGMVADRWRNERILLAGDAAHLMPPFLGQGMCSGIRDAANLSWKLDHVIRRGAPEALLDTYGLERRKHVSAVIQAAVGLGRIICTTDPTEAAERDARLLHGAEGLDEIFRFRLPRLEAGPLVLEGGGALSLQPLPNASEARIDDFVGQRFLVLTEHAGRGQVQNWWRDKLGALVCSAGDLPDTNGAMALWFERQHARFVVVRPDRYVLASGDDLEKISEAVRPWLLGAANSVAADQSPPAHR